VEGSGVGEWVVAPFGANRGSLDLVGGCLSELEGTTRGEFAIMKGRGGRRWRWRWRWRWRMRICGCYDMP